MNIDISDIEPKIKLLKSETTLAQVTLKLFDGWVEKAWRISKSKNEHPVFHDYVWVQPPSILIAGKWQETVFIEDRRLYQDVQTKILDYYYRQKEKENVSQDTYEINPEDVDKANE